MRAENSSVKNLHRETRREHFCEGRLPLIFGFAGEVHPRHLGLARFFGNYFQLQLFGPAQHG